MAALKVIYLGVFLTEAARKTLIERLPPNHVKVMADHVTIAFKPSPTMLEDFKTLVGQRIVLDVVGYFHNDKADAVEVSKRDLPSYCANTKAHITISCSKDTSPVYSNELLTHEDACILPFSSFELEGVYDTFPRTISA